MAGVSRLLGLAERVGGRAIASGGDDVARAAIKAESSLGRNAAKIGGRAAGAGALGLGAITGLRGLGGGANDNNPAASDTQNAGDSYSNAVNMGRPMAGASSARGFTPPANDNIAARISVNANGDIQLEQLKVAVAQANSLSSIDASIKNLLKFEQARATHEARGLDEMSLERGAGGAGVGGNISSVSGMASNGEAGRVSGVALAAIAAIGAVTLVASKSLQNAGDGVNNWISEHNPFKADPNAPPAAPGANPNTPMGRGTQALGDGLLGAAYASDTRNRMTRRAPPAPPAPSAVSNAARIGEAANDNIKPITRIAGMSNRVAGAAGKAVKFLKAIRSSPLGRFPYITAIFASIDPVIAAVDAGTPFTPEVAKQLVGALAMIIGGEAGIILGASIGGAVGSVVPGAGTLVGILAGGLLGAVASFGAEFVAENLFDFVTGKITAGQLTSRLFRGAMSGVSRLPAMATGAVVGTAAGALALGRTAASGISNAVSRAAPAARTGGLTLVRPTGRAVAGLAVGTAAIGTGVALSPRSAPTTTGAPAQATPTNLPEGSELHRAGRHIAESYMGRQLFDAEWDALLRATFAESGGGGQGREDALIMGTIINRARDWSKWLNGGNATTRAFMGQGMTILAVLHAPSQFQAVTGTGPNPGPSANYKAGPRGERLTALLRGIVSFLMKVPAGQTKFTAASSAAYGRGTNISYRDNMLRNGGVTVGRSVFNTNLSGETQNRGTIAPISNPGAVAPSSPSADGGQQPAMPQSAAAGFVAALSNFGRRGAGAAASAPEAGMTNTGAGASSQADPAMSSGWGMPVSGRVSSTFRASNRPGHQGIDIAAPNGSPIFASNSGTVEANQFQAGGAGNYVKIRHANGMRTIYMHMAQRSPLEVGAQVTRGQQIGAVGSTGRSSGNHLHFEVRRGSRGGQVNPATILPGLNAGQVTASAGGAAAVQAAPTATAMSRPTPAGAISAVTNTSTPSNVSPPQTSEVGTKAREIMSTSMQIEKKQNVIHVTTPPASAAPAQKKSPNTKKTDSSAPESVSSPVMSAYAYAAYWGVEG